MQISVLRKKKGAEGPPFLLLLEALPYVVGITVRISGEKPDEKNLPGSANLWHQTKSSPDRSSWYYT